MNKQQRETVQSLDSLMLVLGAATLVVSIAARMYEEGCKSNDIPKEGKKG